MATSNPLYRYKGIIYLIENIVNGKKYVGQTIHTFARRYHRCQWWKGSNNHYLRASFEKYGEQAFTITILAHSKTPEELNRLEAEYAKTFDCYSPKGYNLVECGGSKRQHPDSVAKRSRTITLNGPDGLDITITNIRGFCREKGLDERSLSRVIAGQHASHKGWTLAGVTAKHHRNHHHYTFYQQDGTKHEVTGLTTFCRERGLHYHQMRAMAQGKTFESQGYALSVEAFAHQRQRHVVVIIGHGREVTIRNVKQECRALGLHSAHLYKLINGKIPSYKGWTLKIRSTEPIQWGAVALVSTDCS